MMAVIGLAGVPSSGTWSVLDLQGSHVARLGGAYRQTSYLLLRTYRIDTVI
jgi:hypothetical protein